MIIGCSLVQAVRSKAYFLKKLLQSITFYLKTSPSALMVQLLLK